MIDLQRVLDTMHPICHESEMTEDIEREEGWRAKVYKDHLGYDTIGFGTLLENGIDKVEGTFLAMYRLSKNVDRFEELTGIELTDLPKHKAMALANMCYQLGPDGVAKFRKMIAAIKAGDWLEAGRQGRDSKWYYQTPQRAERVMKELES